MIADSNAVGPLITRIAPSPTGMMHVGTARTALFNWLAARSTGGRFILRIDDTDLERNVEEAVGPIIEGLAWLCLGWDESHRQSDRQDRYRRRAEALLAKGYAFRAGNGAVILRRSDALPSSWDDVVVGRVAISDADAEQISDRLVLMRGGDRADTATYQFASVVDDYEMGVNFVVRGTDHIPNTAKQVAIWAALSAADGSVPAYPAFAHVGLVFKDGRKLSKRDGAASLLDYRDADIHPDAMFNFLLRLGWGPRQDDRTNSILTRERALELFLAGGRMRSASAGLDDAKLRWFDRRIKAAAKVDLVDCGARP